jgi:hypothetical protein
MGTHPFGIANRHASANTADVSGKLQRRLHESPEFKSIIQKILLLISWSSCYLPWDSSQAGFQSWQFWRFWPACAGRTHYNATSSGEVSPQRHSTKWREGGQ